MVALVVVGVAVADPAVIAPACPGDLIRKSGVVKRPTIGGVVFPSNLVLRLEFGDGASDNLVGVETDAGAGLRKMPA